MSKPTVGFTGVGHMGHGICCNIQNARIVLGDTPQGAADSTSGAIVGADPETFARIEPVLQAWSGGRMAAGRKSGDALNL